MKPNQRRLTIALLLLASVACGVPAAAQRRPPPSPRSVRSFDEGWRFFKGDAAGAERPDFDDSAWQRVDAPHDWSIEGPFDERNPTGKDGGYLPAGVGWYRKQFTVPSSDARGRRVFIEFDGVMANSDVWVNGQHLGRRPYGYSGFRYELTFRLKDDAPNVIAVRADNTGQPASRWYTGAGLYRHVRLVSTDPVHIEHWGTFVTTPRVTKEGATVSVESTVVNGSGTARTVSLQVMLVGPAVGDAGSGRTPPQTVAPGASAVFRQQIAVRNPRRWDITDPQMYKAVARVREGAKTLDEETVPFGIRDFKFEPATGFWLNGRNFKLFGVCLHHDGGAFGAAVPLRVWQRRLEILRRFGANAIRTAHNPPSPEFLDLTDHMGFIVMDENFDVWTVAKRPFDYHLYFDEWSKIDTRDMVRRDRNHPSVVIYSTGNEIHDTPKPELAKRVLAGLIEVFHREDPTRPVTQALFRPNVSKDYDNGLADMLDVVGQNYREKEILAAYHQKPTRKILGTENTHAREQWLALRDNPPYSGQFLWTGIDYLGESPGWPLVSFNFGLLDRTATPRPLAFQRLSWWGTTPVVYAARRVAPTPLAPTDPGYGQPDRRPQVLFGDWTPRDLTPHEENVEVYSNAEQVELFLNGRSLGSKARPSDDAPRNWAVPFEPGTLRAVGSNGGRVVATHELKTAGRPARILLSADRARLAHAWDDVAHVEATVVDANGVVVPSASDLISFSVNGPARVAAVDNGDIASHEPFQTTRRRAYQGRCFAMLKATAPRGRATLTATAAGLAPASVTIEAAPASSLKIPDSLPNR
ncbi:MAG TPA: glycoside hydrolase family 2 TIM barrel-domain containing protein [Pyrinomonadaceae bacterium]|jgi:beta-galactosidase|nr:glycoside hydrolase family 2 TIM barrel-domain containing protein [Pyrinomonadaceae bacterium]